MMKTGVWLAAVVLLLGSGQCGAQGILGFFSQQAKKRKLMLAQVAALNLYSNQNATGNSIHNDGLRSAHIQKENEFVAHDDYYTSLEQVNPALNTAQKKKVLLDLQTRILAAFSGEISWQRTNAGLRKDEMDYLVKVADEIRRHCEADSTELQAVVTPGKLKLTDAERLNRLDRLLDSMNDKLTFALSFTGQCRKLAQARGQQRLDQEQVKKLYGH